MFEVEQVLNIYIQYKSNSMCNFVETFFNTSSPGGDQQGRQEWRRRKRS